MSETDSAQLRIIITTIIVCVYIAWQSGKMGYSRVLWFFVALLSHPLIALTLIAGLPNRSLQRQRIVEMDLLERQLATAGRPGQSGATIVPRRTISDQETIGEASSQTAPAGNELSVAKGISSWRWCPQCNKLLPDSAKFCGVCGSKLLPAPFGEDC